jgi:hypothetical protein
MLDTEPLGKPFSGPQKSCRYCDMARFGSVADVGTAKHAKANPTIARPHSPRLPEPSSRKVFKLLNHDLTGFLQRTFVAGDHEIYQTELGLSWRRYARRELMFRERSARVSRPSPEGFESRASLFPAH